jgi:hypothetical protein
MIVDSYRQNFLCPILPDNIFIQGIPNLAGLWDCGFPAAYGLPFIFLCNDIIAQFDALITNIY